ncbi:ski2-like helicase [compost metagenome]
MDRVQKTAALIVDLNNFFSKKLEDYELVKKVCDYFDSIKRLKQSPSDLKFLKYVSNIAGIPHYYDLLFKEFGQESYFENFDLNTISSVMYESTLHIDEHIKIHRFQKKVLDQFIEENENRYFLSATTSFGKTFLIYEIIKKLKYRNVALIFPTIALLSENYGRLFTDKNYSYFYDTFAIHTLSDIGELADNNIFIFTPERYLSFMDKYPNIKLDFVFVDEIYKIDNEYVIDTMSLENERDTAYRVALQNILTKSKDILLVGPYIEFPNKDDLKLNQSFNTFLNSNRFSIIDYNKYEIVNKTSTIIKNGKQELSDGLVLNLKGFSGKTIGDKISQTISDIRAINENAIIYTSGPARAETNARKIIESSSGYTDEKSALNSFIEHLIATYKHPEWIIIEGLKNKVGVHHGLVPKYIQKEIINFFNNGDIDVLVSTTTITEGVNTSAKNLLVISAKKGDKDLKTFDAKNIAGRAGRFLYHYSGRVLIFDKKFESIISGYDNEIKHKNFDLLSKKDEIDYFITDEAFLAKDDIEKRRLVLQKQAARGIPDEIMSMFRVISHSDKIIIYDNICALNSLELAHIRNLISSINGKKISIDYDGFNDVLNIIRPIVRNKNLQFLIDNKTPVKSGQSKGELYSTMTHSLYAYLAEGFEGSVNYNLKKAILNNEKHPQDKAIRDTSKFIFNTLKYQLVKYLGAFNLMYKFHISKVRGISIDEVAGIDPLLLKLEYNATSYNGRLASDYGVPSKIVEYYDHNESNEIKKRFDQFELSKLAEIEMILNKK